ncbi:MAG: AI-2E family transporter [Minisyncoccia bacterium]
MNKEIRVSITPGTIFAALGIVLGAYLLWVLRDLALLVLTAIVIASAIEPAVSFFTRRRMPRFISVMLVYLLVLGSIFAFLYYFFSPIIEDAANFLSSVPQYLSTLNAATPFSNAASTAGFTSAQQQALQPFMQTLTSLQTASSYGVLQLFFTFFGGIFSSLIVVVLSFYFALQDTGIDDFLRLAMPVAHEAYAVDLWRRSQKKIGLWMQGQVLLSALVGILTYLGLLIIGVPYALLLSVFTAMAEIIPIFGSLIAGAIAAIVAYYSGGLALAAIVAGLFIVINQFESNLIYPLIVRKIVGLPPLLVLVALMAGYALAGFLGSLLSVPIAAVGLEFINDFDKRKRKEAHARAQASA